MGTGENPGLGVTEVPHPGDPENEPRQAKPDVPRVAPSQYEGTEQGPLSYPCPCIHAPGNADLLNWGQHPAGAAPPCLRSGQQPFLPRIRHNPAAWPRLGLQDLGSSGGTSSGRKWLSEVTESIPAQKASRSEWWPHHSVSVTTRGPGDSPR